MKLNNLALLLCLTVTLLLAKRHTETLPHSQFSRVIDLSSDASRIQLPQQMEIPAERMIAPVAVLDVSKECGAMACALSMEAVGRWEAAHGPIPPGALVLARGPEKHSIVITPETARFLTDARMVFGLGSEAPNLDSDGLTSRELTLKNVYQLGRLTGISETPEAGAVGVVAPQHTKSGLGRGVRVLVLVEQS